MVYSRTRNTPAWTFIKSTILRFFDDLINELQDCGHIVKIYDVEEDSLAFADDIDIISLSRNGLQKMSDISYRYSRKWRFKFSAPKCIVMTFGHSLDQQPITLGGELLMEVTFCINLGTRMYSKPEHELEEVENRIAKSYKKVWMLKSIGSRSVQMNPMTFARGYCAVVVSTLCYGMFRVNLKKGSLDNLDKMHVDSQYLCISVLFDTHNPLYICIV